MSIMEIINTHSDIEYMIDELNEQGYITDDECEFLHQYFEHG